MNHILDNPIWNALTTGSQKFSVGTGNAKYLFREMGAFAGLSNNSESDFQSLYSLTPLNTRVILFTPDEIVIPEGWNILLSKPLLQMVYRAGSNPSEGNAALVRLQEEDVPAMVDLTARTNPGPFLSRTIDFGNYEGVFDGGKLVAMTGQRLQPDPYTEVSAVCTDPAYTGKGYAAMLIRSQINSILSESRIPFLHVLPDNLAALNLYLKLGFETRKEMIFYVLERTSRH